MAKVSLGGLMMGYCYEGDNGQSVEFRTKAGTVRFGDGGMNVYPPEGEDDMACVEMDAELMLRLLQLFRAPEALERLQQCLDPSGGRRARASQVKEYNLPDSCPHWGVKLILDDDEEIDSDWDPRALVLRDERLGGRVEAQVSCVTVSYGTVTVTSTDPKLKGMAHGDVRLRAVPRSLDDVFVPEGRSEDGAAKIASCSTSKVFQVSDAERFEIHAYIDLEEPISLFDEGDVIILSDEDHHCVTGTVVGFGSVCAKTTKRDVIVESEDHHLFDLAKRTDVTIRAIEEGHDERCVDRHSP